MYFGIISKLSYFCCAVHLLSYYIWSFCALAKFTYFVIFCILDNRCKRLKFNQYTFNKTTARPFFFRAVWQRYQTRFKTPDSHSSNGVTLKDQNAILSRWRDYFSDLLYPVDELMLHRHQLTRNRLGKILR